MQGNIRLWNPSHPQTVKIAVGLGYWLGIASLLGLSGGSASVTLLLLWALDILGVTLPDGIVVLVNILVGAGFALSALGMANDKRYAWRAGVVLSVTALAGLVLGAVFLGTDLFGVIFQGIFVGAWVGGMLHPMTRDYVKVWFE